MNYYDKYKDRPPNETIKIIANFFQQKDLTIKEEESHETEIQTWWVTLRLYYKNYFIMKSNGKGMTKEFSRASAYAELYERFCNASNEMYATQFYQDIKQKRYNKYNYYLDKEEKEVSFYEATQTSPRIKFKFDLMNDNDNHLEELYNITFNKLIAVPFKQIGNEKQIKYLVPEIVQATTGSDGMAAGNSLEEALVQGISEIYEHMVWNKVYENHQDIKTPELNFNDLNLPLELKEKGNKLKELGYDFKIFDYSYIYNIPVIGILLINIIDYNFSLILGAFPIFEIALERCFTEIYQGFLTLQNKDKLFIPFKNIEDNIYYQYKHFGSLSCRNYYNESQFYNTKIYTNYNDKIFYNKKLNSNQDLLNYYIDLNKKLSLNFYYKNFSYIDNFFAVHVFLDNYNIFYHMHYQFYKYQFNNDIKNKSLQFLIKLKKSEKEFIKNNNFNLLQDLALEYKNEFLYDSSFYDLIFDYLYYIPDLFSLFYKDDSYLKLFFKILNGDINNNIYLYNYINSNKIYYPIIQENNNNLNQKWLILILLSEEKYSINEIKLIFKNIFNQDINFDINLDKFIFFKNNFLITEKNNDYKNYIKNMNL